eukprot:COSAG06_NODE_3980_length_4692_cov_4.531679_4_plen_55_part_01
MLPQADLGLDGAAGFSKLPRVTRIGKARGNIKKGQLSLLKHKTQVCGIFGCGGGG